MFRKGREGKLWNKPTVSPCLHHRSAVVEMGGVGGRKWFVTQMGLSNKNVLEVLENRKTSLN